MDLHKKVNQVALFGFVMLFMFGASETGYHTMGDNLVGLMLMIFGVLGLLIQFVFLNISLMNRK